MTTIMQLLIHIRGGVSLVMSSVLAVVKNFRLGIILALACLACILSYVPAVSQTSPTQLPNPLKLGVRTSVYPIGNNINVNFLSQFFPEYNFMRVFFENNIYKPNSAEGFCGTFGKELQKELASKGQQIKVKYIPIVNQHKGFVAPRYYGLKKGIIDIECGPNSISSGKLPTGEGIEFSQPFYKTGVKLLLKEELADKLNSKLIELKEIKIGVVKESTTLEVLSKNNLKFVEYDSGREALNALEVNDVNAYASDALIVANLLKKGVDQPEQPKREPYENLEYTIYPNSSSTTRYLTGNKPTEEYAMAVLGRTPFSKDLLNVINNTLYKSKLSSYQQILENYETRADNFWWNILKKTGRFSKNYLWVIFVPIFWELLIEYSSLNVPIKVRKKMRSIAAIIVGILIIFILINVFLVYVIPLVIPGY
ncbi:transporter substrate-binding domain-containing protein [Microcoleus sp. w2-18bC1]|uniref:transporter substrate-binding domain-containing protein n=1 Tax=unclassified Microcoleus TaxID=2642155 RepID=UPI002FD69686